MAGVDLEICNFAAVSVGGASVLYPAAYSTKTDPTPQKIKRDGPLPPSREATHLDWTRTGRHPRTVRSQRRRDSRDVRRG